MKNNFKNIVFPIFTLFVIPIIVILLIYYTTQNKDNFKITPFSIMTFFVLLGYGYLSIILNKKKFIGPKNVDGVEPVYADNGFGFYSLTVLLTLFIVNYFKGFSQAFINNFLSTTLTFTIAGYLFATYLYLKYKDNYFNKDKDEDSELFKFFRGLEYHPKILGVDIKQLTNCRFGMISWQIFIIIFAKYYFKKVGKINYPILFSVLLQSIYIAKFFYWETGYFNTLDITLDKAGYYICWGCLVFVPCFYTFTTFYMVNKDPKLSFEKCLMIFILGCYFTYKNYEVDLQKEIFKKLGKNMELNGKKVETMELHNKIKNKKTNFLLSGHWAQARHANYTYEILLSLCWSLFGYDTGLLVFTYFFYIVILLLHRIQRDERKCLNKYGDDYKKYMEKVPYKLIKHVY